MGLEKVHGRLNPICRKAIEKGDGLPWIKLEGFPGGETRAQPVFREGLGVH
jgi:hypothetical protein